MRALGEEDQPASTFGALAQLVYGAETLNEVYDILCRTAPSLVTGCDHASVLLAHRDRFTTAAASDNIAAEIDKAEQRIGDGPCMDAIMDETAQIVPDLTDAQAWTQLSTWVAAHTPVRAAMAFRLTIDGKKVGALNLFANDPEVFTARAADEGAVLASFASVALLAASRGQEVTTLREGLDSNREIGKAIGLLMAFHHIDDRAAFAMLAKTSQDLNLKLARVAEEIVKYHQRQR